MQYTQSSDKQSASPNLETITAPYFTLSPNPDNPQHHVSFGTSGHRGVASKGSFNEAHILAITQAVCDFRKHNKINGPLFMGADTHALSPLAFATALEVLTANKIFTIIQNDDKAVPTPVISHSILQYNRLHAAAADGIVITPSHNPPEYGGFKYNETHGGPAETTSTHWIEQRANQYLQDKNKGILRRPNPETSEWVIRQNLLVPYVKNLPMVVNIPLLQNSGLKLGADPMGGSTIHCWALMAEMLDLPIDIVNPRLDPLFSFMPADHDGKIRMDCSSPWAMAHLVKQAANYDLAFACDPDGDRHGVVTAQGLMPANNFLCSAASYLLQCRQHWPKSSLVGKTAVTSLMLDLIAAAEQSAVYETPVGFKWFVQGLLTKQLLFACEESAGASFLCFDGTTWSTDKDGMIMGLLAAEMTAQTQQNPAERYATLSATFGSLYFARKDAAATSEQKQHFAKLSPDTFQRKEFGGDPILDIRTKALGNKAPVGGIKVVTANAWFVARPSGTEELYKIYAESRVSEKHLEQILEEAEQLINALLQTER